MQECKTPQVMHIGKISLDEQSGLVAIREFWGHQPTQIIAHRCAQSMY